MNRSSRRTDITLALSRLYTASKLLLRIAGSIVVARYRSASRTIVSIVARIHILHLVAVLMIGHISMNVCLIVGQVDRCRMSVMLWIIAPVIRRMPRGIAYSTQIGVDGRRLIVNRRNVVVRSVNITCTYHLYIRRSIVHLHNQRSHILIYILSQNSLDHKYVRTIGVGFHHAKIIYPSIAIQVKRRKHIAR